MTGRQAEIQKKQLDAAMKVADENKKSGAAFLAANKDKPGVITTKSGLQYKILKEGTGALPKSTDEVTVNYEGRLIDAAGTVFDASAKHGGPSKLHVDEVIKGWTEALQLMKVGSKWQLYIPSDLAYGPNPRPGGPIGPNAVLVFDVELLDITK